MTLLALVQEVDEQAMYITYAYDAFTFGVQSNESDSAVAGADSEFSGVGSILRCK